MRWTNRQYVDLMTYNHPERPMFSELFGPIIGLPEEWRAQGHKLAFHGGIDKHVLREFKEAIRAEVDAKMQDCMMEGILIFSAGRAF